MTQKYDGRKNLIPFKNTEEARAKGKAGGIKSGQVRREKKLISEKLAEYFGEKNLDSYFDSLMNRRDAVSLGLLKEAREATEGTKQTTEFTGSININITGVKAE